MRRTLDFVGLVLGIALVIAGIMAIIYFMSPEFQQKINNSAAQIGAPE
jgi:uncharacterized membrane protein HdeD (DUF308 family)